MKKFSLLLAALVLFTVSAGCMSSRSSIGIIGGADGPTSVFVSDAQGIITAEDAETIALSHAGLTPEQADRIHSSLDTDDGILQYEVEIQVGRTEYDCEIHAVTGEILSFEKESTY